jgi:hypothetical protein
VHVRGNDPGFILVLLAFVISAICASVFEKSRLSPQVASGSA